MLSLPSPEPPIPSSPRSAGRPRALDEAKLREICALISAGCGVIGAARYVGCAASTIRREARRNREFNEQLRRANLAAELAPLNALRQAANRHWRAAAWLLERADAQRYGKPNLRYLKPEQLKEFADQVGQIVNDEIEDDETVRRVSVRFERMIREFDREAAAELDPFPAPRQPK